MRNLKALLQRQKFLGALLQRQKFLWLLDNGPEKCKSCSFQTQP